MDNIKKDVSGGLFGNRERRTFDFSRCFLSALFVSAETWRSSGAIGDAATAAAAARPPVIRSTARRCDTAPRARPPPGWRSPAP